MPFFSGIRKTTILPGSCLHERLNLLKKIGNNMPLHFRLVEGNVSPRGDSLLSFGTREELTGFFLA